MNITINAVAMILTDKTKKLCSDGDRSYCQYLNLSYLECGLFDLVKLKGDSPNILRCKKCLKSKVARRK